MAKPLHAEIEVSPGGVYGLDMVGVKVLVITLLAATVLICVAAALALTDGCQVLVHDGHGGVMIENGCPGSGD